MSYSCIRSERKFLKVEENNNLTMGTKLADHEEVERKGSFTVAIRRNHISLCKTRSVKKLKTCEES